MLFHTFEFLIFAVIFTVLYFAMRRRVTAQNSLILAGSWLFYGWWDVRFLHLLLISTALDYSTAIVIDKGSMSGRARLGTSLFAILSAVLLIGVNWSGGVLAPQLATSSTALWSVAITGGAVLALNALYLATNHLRHDTKRRIAIWASMVGNLGILLTFKYFDFFAASLASLAQSTFGFTPSDWTLGFVLPVGISFYTFQTMSYTIDVYRRDMPAETRFVNFAAYVAYFPQLVAGPIERGTALVPQFGVERKLPTFDQVRRGSWLIAWGLFKKVVIADNMAAVVNGIFGPYDGGDYAIPKDGLTLLVGVYAFAFQIYGDFSGYTDMARGISKLLGFELMRNFDLPYFATSPSDFWRRWHISLSSWLRDYLYIPLGGNKGGSWSTYRNLSVTMLLGGLWHGASWNFVIWGAYHGLLLSIYRALGVRTERGAYSPLVTFLLGLLMFHLTCIGWLLFRAQDVGTISAFFQGIFLHPTASDATWEALGTVVRFCWILIAFEIVQFAMRTHDPMARWPWFVRLNVWVLVITAILAMASSKTQDFIYFAF